MTRDLNNAVPLLKIFGEELIKRSKSDLRLIVIITCVARTVYEQMAILLQGRLKLRDVNLALVAVGLAPLKSEAENKIVSWTLDSKHIINPFDSRIDNDKAKAFDFGVLDANGKYQGSLKADVNKDNQSDYEQVCKLAEKIRSEMDIPIVLGRDFSTPDYPHIQYGV